MRLNQKCPVCGKPHGEVDKYCSIKCAFNDSNAVQCSQGMDVMMYCPDAKCPYHNAVKERELEKNPSYDQLKSQLTAAQDEITLLKAQLAEHEQKGLAIYGRKIEVLSGTVRVLEAKLERCKEQRNFLIVKYNDWTSGTDYDQELNSITLESLKGE